MATATARGQIIVYLIDIIFPRLEETMLLRREYLSAVADYNRTHGQVGEREAIEAADAFNAKKYCWQRPLRAAIWKEV